MSRLTSSSATPDQHSAFNVLQRTGWLNAKVDEAENLRLTQSSDKICQEFIKDVFDEDTSDVEDFGAEDDDDDGGGGEAAEESGMYPKTVIV